jgi:hypothetical protein
LLLPLALGLLLPLALGLLLPLALVGILALCFGLGVESDVGLLLSLEDAVLAVIVSALLLAQHRLQNKRHEYAIKRKGRKGKAQYKSLLFVLELEDIRKVRGLFLM